MTDMNTRRQLHAGLRAIASVDADRANTHNNVGFSKIDVSLGHKLAESDPSTWSLRQVYAAWKILRRYRNTQLPLFGIDFSQIEEPEKPQEVITPERTGYHTTYDPATGMIGGGRATIPAAPAIDWPASTVTLLGDRIALSWPYGEPDFHRKKDTVKGIAGRLWNPEAKVWTVPQTSQAIEAVGELIAEYADRPSPFELEDHVAAAIDQAAERLIQNVKGSHAADSDYEVLGLRAGLALFPFQRAGVKYIVDNKEVIVGDDMGLGKTPQAIAAVADTGSWPMLVVCPSSLKLNWQREILRWVDPAIGHRMIKPGSDLHSLIIHVASGTKDIGMPEPIDVLIVNYDILEAWMPLILDVPWGAVVCDEAHYLKNHKTKRTKAVKEILKTVKPDYRIMLTGTPFLSRPIEGWTLIDMIGHGGTVGGWQHYTYRYCARVDGRFGMDVSGASNLGELNQTLRENGAYIRRRKADVLKELPPRQWATVPLEMTAAGAKAYDRAVNDLAGFISEQRAADEQRHAEWRAAAEAAYPAEMTDRERWIDAYIGKAEHDYRISEAAKVAQAEQLVRFEALKQLAYAGKRQAVFDWIETFLESGEKLIVFANHREVVNEIAAKYAAPKIMGGMDVADVEAGKTRFQNDPECKVIVCNIRAGGVGHTLTAASNVAFVELGWTPADMDQALDRAHRIGQTESVTGWVLTAQLPDGEETIDGEIAAILEKKRAVVTAAADGAGAVEQISVLEELRSRLAGKRSARGA